MVEVPSDDLRRVREAHRRLRALLGDLRDDQARQPTHLPGWTVGHLLTHLARNADAFRQVGLAALRGEARAMYAGDEDGRDADIQRGAARSAADLVGDVDRAALALDTVWSTLPRQAWAVEVSLRGGAAQPYALAVPRRWREVEIHLVDLDLGLGVGDWSPAFVAAELPKMRRGLPARLPAGVAAPAPGSVDERSELAWLYGRAQPPGLPELGAWS